MKIKTKLTLVFLVISLLPLLLLTSLFYSSEKITIVQQITRQLTSVASLQHARIKSIIKENKERFSLVSSRTQLRISLDSYLKEGKQKDQDKMIHILKDTLASIKSFATISIISLDGTILVSTAAKSFSENIYFDQKIFTKGQTEISADTFFLNNKQNLSILLAGPLQLDGTLLGVMLIETDPENIFSTVHNYSGLGETGEILIVSRNEAGKLISLTPTRFNKEAALWPVLENETNDCPLVEAFNKKATVSTNCIDYRLQPVITVVQYIEDPNWVVLVKIDQAEANIPIIKLRNLSIGIALLLMTVISVISIYLAEKITHPISKLTKSAKNISTGDFSYCDVETSTDEIGILAKAFNEMTDNLRIAKRKLEGKFQELHLEVQDRHKAEAELAESEERYREIYNAPSDAILMHDAAAGTILDANRAALEIYDYSYDELLKQNIGDLSSGEPPYDMEHGAQKVMLAMTEGPQLFEWRAKKQNGDLLWVEVALRSTEFSGQKYVIAVVRDISERKKAEEDLAAEQERLAVTLRSIGDGVITTDINGNIVLINKIAETLTGWSQEEASGKALPDVFNIINERTRQPCVNPVTKVLADGEVIGLANHTVLIAKDGSEYSIADSGAPIRDKKSEIIGVVLVFRDVTEEKRREDELAKGRKLESVGLLAGGIAHDFNNILTAILGNLNLALLYTDPEEKSYCLLQDAEKASIRARDLTQQLLTFAKGGEPVKELADIKDIIQDSAQFVLRGSNVRCDFHCGDDVWPVEIDQGQVSQVVQNIIINANQAMPGGGTIEISCSNVNRDQCHTLHLASREYLRVTIRDSGIGMAPSLLDKIFDPYFTTKQEGSGLGLAVSHSIISKHDGYIFASSEPRIGTTFTLYLPAETKQQPVVNIQQKTLDELPGQGKIMVMDDDAMVRSISQNMLKYFGYEVILAKDGKQAITFYKEARKTDTPVDLIIMDLTIPGGMGGKEAVQEIHRIDPKAKVIVSSGYSNDPIMSNCQAYGFLAAIVKPFQLHDLRTTIRNILQSTA